MDNEHEGPATPILIRAHLVIREWPNRSARHEQPLAAATYMAGVDESLRKARRLFEVITFPFGATEERYVRPADWITSSFRDRARQIREEVEIAVEGLRLRWPEVMAEAKQRLGTIFAPGDFPSPDDLHAHIGVSLQYDIQERVSSLDLLKNYSSFYREVEGPDWAQVSALKRQWEDRTRHD